LTHNAHVVSLEATRASSPYLGDVGGLGTKNAPLGSNGFPRHVVSNAFETSTMGCEEQPVPRQFDVVIERDSDGYYVASVPQLAGCHTQARSLDEVTERIREAIELCLEAEGTPEQELEFVGIQRVTVAA
jgi:predicted RNase H-like HicB family nuclease